MLVQIGLSRQRLGNSISGRPIKIPSRQKNCKIIQAAAPRMSQEGRRQVSSPHMQQVMTRELDTTLSTLVLVQKAAGLQHGCQMGMSMQVLFVECGTGADQHGQNVTKAAARACRNAIEFNSIPSVSRLVPGGYENLLLHIKIGVPHPASTLLEPVLIQHSHTF